MQTNKRKRREIDAKLKEQKSRKVAKLSENPTVTEFKEKIDIIMKKISDEGLPKFLPTELLEDLANGDKTKKKRFVRFEFIVIKSKYN